MYLPVKENISFSTKNEKGNNNVEQKVLKGIFIVLAVAQSVPVCRRQQSKCSSSSTSAQIKRAAGLVSTIRLN